MSRALMSATVADQAGNAIQGAVVDVYETGTTTPVADLFTASSGGSPVATLTSDGRGHVEGWFTVGRLVDLKVTDNGHTAYRPASPSIHLTFADYTITVAALAVSTDLATQAALDAEAALRVSGDAASVATAAADATAKVAAETNARGTAVTAEASARVAGDAASVATAAADATTKANAAQAASQPLDSDLTAIAALSTTAYGRAFLALADAAAGRTALGLGTAAVAASTAFDAAGAAAAAQAASQPLDSDLTAIAALSTTSFGRSFLDRADAAAGRTLLGLGTAATTDSTAYASLAGNTFTAEQVATDFKATGKTGATAQATILAGGTTSGAPTTGAHVVGELVYDATGVGWYCTAAGTPGTWVQVGGSSSASVTITQQAADYTLVLADAGTEVEGTKATAQNVTVPPNSSVAFPTGTVINVRQYGAGQVTLVAGGGVTLRAPNGLKTAHQYSTASLVKRGTDEWIVGGDVTT